MDITLHLDEPTIGLLQRMANNISITKYIERMVKREVEAHYIITADDLTISPKIRQLTLKPTTPVPADVNKTSDIIEEKNIW